MKPAFFFYLLLKTTLFHVRSLHYKGRNVHCPICHFDGAMFLPSPDGLPQARCPRCNSLERHRAQWLFGLRDYLAQKTVTPRRILHFSPEDCLASQLLRTKSIRYATSAYSRFPLFDYAIDVQDIPLPDASFDGVICNHILEHVDNDRRALTEIFRILKIGGVAFIQVPIFPEQPGTYEDPSITTPEARRAAFGQEDHVRSYGPDFTERCACAGFAVQSIDFWNRMEPALFKKYALLVGDPIVICKKT